MLRNGGTDGNEIRKNSGQIGTHAELKQCLKELDGNKAVGIDEMTKEEYGRNLDANVTDLVERLKRKAYKPQPAMRVYLPKDNGKMRPLAIACYEDKIVQMALKKILEAIYEPQFLENMYGFRPGKGCHDAIKVVYRKLNNDRICYRKVSVYSISERNHT